MDLLHHEQFKSKQEMWMQYDQKSRKDKIIYHNIAKQAHADITGPATHLKDSQHMGRDVGMCQNEPYYNSL